MLFRKKNKRQVEIKENKIVSDEFLASFFLRLRELLGGILILFASIFFIAMFFYNSNDPSFNTVTTLKTLTPLLKFGAIFADFGSQFFGILKYLLVVSFLFWGIKLIFHNTKTIALSHIFFVFIGTSLISLSFQVFNLESIILNKISDVNSFTGNFGFMLAKLLYNLLEMYGYSKFFLIILFSSFFLGIIFFQHGIGLKFYDVIFSTFSFILKSIKFLSKVFSKFFFFFKNVFKKKLLMKKENQSNQILHFEEILAKKHLKKNYKEKSSISNDNFLRKNGEEYSFPNHTLLANFKNDHSSGATESELKMQSKKLIEVLTEFGVSGEIINIKEGPVVTMYEFRPAPGIKTARIIGLSEDISRSMSAISTRIAVIPGKNAIGIELPNKKREIVQMKELIESETYESTANKLPLILGKDISGEVIVADLAKMPHLLVAGTTGSGKSVSINTMILSLLFKFKPSECKFIMIDPKMLELSVYQKIPHLLTEVVTEPKKAVYALKWAVREMENRYKAMSSVGVRSIDGYNERVLSNKTTGEVIAKKIRIGFAPETGAPLFENEANTFEFFPYIVIIVDEMADLMIVAGKEIESAIQRLSQMARAAGIHLIMATQRPSVDVITGTIKANFPTRISFQVTSKIDSRTILGEQGAEALLGNGDMLYMVGGGKIQRIHGPFVSDVDVEKIAEFIRSQAEPEFIAGVTDESEDDFSLEGSLDSQKDDLYSNAIDLIRREKKISISFIQRHLQIGYNRAASIVEKMEKNGVVTEADKNGKRKII